MKINKYKRRISFMLFISIVKKGQIFFLSIEVFISKNKIKSIEVFINVDIIKSFHSLPYFLLRHTLTYVTGTGDTRMIYVFT